MRRVLGALTALSLIVGPFVTATPARAQDNVVTLRLLRQTPWCTAYDHPTLRLSVLAQNSGATGLDDLAISVSIGPRYLNRAEFEASLDTPPATSIAQVVQPLEGELIPGSARTMQIEIDLSQVSAIDQQDSQTYPATVTLTSGGVPLTSIVTPVIYLVREPEKPLLSNTRVDILAPVAFDSAGIMVEPAFEAAIAPGGALRAPLDVIAAILARRPTIGLDLVVSPMAVTQARDMADGYQLPDGGAVGPDDAQARFAATFVQQLSALVSEHATIELVAQPFADPQLPVMLNSGLAGELAAQRTSGTAVLDALGGLPATGVARPAAGQLSDETLSWLASAETSVVLGDASTIERVPGADGAAPPPAVPVETASGSMTYVLPDPSVQAMFVRPDIFDDPVWGAQVVLGQIAVIWKERPVPPDPEVRGVAVAPPSWLPPGVWAPLLHRLTQAPFLDPVTATSVAREVDPGVSGPLSAPSQAAFDPGYAVEIDLLSRDVDAYASMLQADDALGATDLRRDTYIATSQAYIADPEAGQQWLDEVQGVTSAAFAAVTPRVSGVYTFSSREGTIALVMGDPGDTPLQVTVQLESPQFTYPEGDSKDVLVDIPNEIVQFPVVARTSGQSPILVSVRAPNEHVVADEITVAVRTTAVNRIALMITIAAAIALFGLYSRRWLRRPKTPS